MFTDPGDVGFGSISRRRAFCIFLRKDAGTFIHEPQALYDKCCSRLASRQVHLDNLCWASEQQVHEEIKNLISGTSRSREQVLTKFEQDNQKLYEKTMDARGIPADQQVYVPSQNPEFLSKMTSAGVLPAFTCTDKIVWIRKLDRPLCAIEKFSGHGYPMTPELAQCLSVPVPCRSFCERQVPCHASSE